MILGINASGRAIQRNNEGVLVKGVTEDLINYILQHAGVPSEYISLAGKTILGCQGCLKCASDNICKTDDDFPALAEKVRKAEALVIGAYCPYGMVDGYTKAFLERLWSMRHVKNLNEGKLVVIVVSGLVPTGISRPRKFLVNKMEPIYRKSLPLNQVSEGINRAMRMENMEVIGTIKIRGNVPCLTCGNGSTCKMSGVPTIFGKGVKASSDLCVSVEDQPETWKEINHFGQMLGDRLS